jgi:hypothetical protein
MKAIIRRTFGRCALPAFVMMCSAAGYQTYLLEARPAVAMVEPVERPSNWVCAKAITSRHCVQVSSRERTLRTILLGLLPFCIVLVAGDLLLRRRPDGG